MKCCSSCSKEHNQPRSELCVACQHKKNHKKYRERKKNPESYPVLSWQERYAIRKEKQLQYYRKRRGLPADYVPSYRSKEIKKCEACGADHDRPRAMICSECQKKVTAKKNYEWQKKARKKDPQLFLDRIKKSQKKNPDHYRELYRKHYKRRYNLPDDHIFKDKRKSGEGNINWQGYKRITKRDHPNAQASGVILEHIYVMSSHLGRPLFEGETVHHVNGDRLDNRIENLELWHRSHPPGQRVDDKIKWCVDFLLQYGYRVEKCLANATIAENTL